MKSNRYETRKAVRRLQINEIDKILFAVSEATGISEEAIKNKERKQFLSDARHLFCYMTWKLTDLPLQVIGEKINRNHSSVIHSRDVADVLKDTDKSFGHKLEEATRIYMSS